MKAKLVPHLTLANRAALLEWASGKSKRQIEEMVTALAPRADAPAVVRKLPESCPAEPIGTLELGPDRAATPAAPAPPRPAVVQPLAPGRFKVQFTASAAFRDNLQRLQALMRSSVPDGDLSAILEAAVTEKLQRLEAKRFGATTTPRKNRRKTYPPARSSRYVAAAVRRAVHERDGSRCRCVNEQGRRCTERNHLEFHHVRAYGRGGPPSVENLQLMCPAHNALLAERDYGKGRMARYRRSAGYTVPSP